MDWKCSDPKRELYFWIVDFVEFLQAATSLDLWQTHGQQYNSEKFEADLHKIFFSKN